MSVTYRAAKWYKCVDMIMNFSLGVTKNSGGVTIADKDQDEYKRSSQALGKHGAGTTNNRRLPHSLTHSHRELLINEENWDKSQAWPNPSSLMRADKYTLEGR